MFLFIDQIEETVSFPLIAQQVEETVPHVPLIEQQVDETVPHVP